MTLAPVLLFATSFLLLGCLFLLRRFFRCHEVFLGKPVLVSLIASSCVAIIALSFWLYFTNSLLPTVFYLSICVSMSLALALLFLLGGQSEKQVGSARHYDVDSGLENVKIDLFENAIDPIFIVDAAFRYRDVNRRAVETFGFSRDEFLTMSIFDVIPPEQVPASKEELKKLKTCGYYEHFSGKMRHKDGSWRDIEVGSSAIFKDGQIIGSCDIVRDISARKAAENKLIELNQRLEQQAYHDSLTGLPNRRLLYQQMDHCIARCRRNSGMFAVLYIDLDKFKLINDQFGHKEGDLVLRSFADRLQENSRETDIIARIGGDEFIVLIEDLESIDSVETVLNHLHQLFMSPVDVNERQHLLNISIGVSLYPRDAQTPDDLLTRADHDMYVTKRDKSKSSVVF